MDVPMEAVGLQVNQCIVRSETAQGVLNIVRDLLPVFDRVNIATSMHRLAKLVKDNKVSMQYLPYTALCKPVLSPCAAVLKCSNVWALDTCMLLSIAFMTNSPHICHFCRRHTSAAEPSLADHPVFISKHAGISCCLQ